MEGSAIHKPGANPKIRPSNPNSGRSACAEYPMGKRRLSGVPKFFRRNNILMTIENIDKYYTHLGYAEKKEALRTANSKNEKAELELEINSILKQIKDFKK